MGANHVHMSISEEPMSYHLVGGIRISLKVLHLLEAWEWGLCSSISVLLLSHNVFRTAPGIHGFRLKIDFQKSGK